MLHDGHEFHVGESHTSNIVRQLGRELAIGKRAMLLLGHAHPGTEMHFISGDGTRKAVVLVSLLHPGLIAPNVVEMAHD